MTQPKSNVINDREALAKAIDRARVSATAEAWALIAIALHVTDSHAVFDPATGLHKVLPEL